MANMRKFLLLALLFVGQSLFVSSVYAVDDFNLNMFPSEGKPVYAVLEFSDYLPDPQEVAVATPDEYLNSGMSRPDFLDRTNVRKLSKNRFLLTSQDPIDSNNFVLLMDVTYDGSRKFYPYEVTIGKNQAGLTLGKVREYRAAEPPPAAVPPRVPMNIPVQQTDSTPEQVVEIKTEPQQQKIVVTTEPVRNDTTIKESSMFPTQPQVMYAQAPQLAGNSDTLPFYIMAIVMTVLVLLAILAIGMFFHMSSHKEKTSHKKSDDEESGMSHLIKLLPTLLGVKEDLAAAGANQNPMQNYGTTRRAAPAFYDDEFSRHQQPQGYAFQGDVQQYAQPQPSPQAAPETHYAPPVAPQSLPEPQSKAPIQRPVVPPKPRSAPQQAAPKVKPEPTPQAKAPAQPARPTQPQPAPQANAPAQPQRPAPAARPARQPAPQAKVAPQQPAQKPIQQPSQAQQQQADVKAAPKETPAVAKSEKLQLAVVYMNMGDDVMARMLLDELIREGSDAERSEAQILLSKMDDNGSTVPFIADGEDK